MTQAASTRILGIDPGLQVAGFGVIEASGLQLHYVASGTIRTAAASGLPQRLKTLFEGIEAVLERPRCSTWSSACCDCPHCPGLMQPTPWAWRSRMPMWARPWRA